MRCKSIDAGKYLAVRLSSVRAKRVVGKVSEIVRILPTQPIENCQSAYAAVYYADKLFHYARLAVFVYVYDGN